MCWNIQANENLMSHGSDQGVLLCDKIRSPVYGYRLLLPSNSLKGGCRWQSRPITEKKQSSSTWRRVLILFVACIYWHGAVEAVAWSFSSQSRSRRRRVTDGYFTSADWRETMTMTHSEWGFSCCCRRVSVMTSKASCHFCFPDFLFQKVIDFCCTCVTVCGATRPGRPRWAPGPAAAPLKPQEVKSEIKMTTRDSWKKRHGDDSCCPVPPWETTEPQRTHQKQGWKLLLNQPDTEIIRLEKISFDRPAPGELAVSQQQRLYSVTK